MLVTKKTHTIGVVVTMISDPFIAELVSGIEETANDHGDSVFLVNSNASPPSAKSTSGGRTAAW